MPKYRIYVTGSITDWIELEGDSPEELKETAINEFTLGRKGVVFDQVEVDGYEELP